MSAAPHNVLPFEQPDAPLPQTDIIIELEQAVIGAVLHDNRVLDAITDLDGSNFFEPLHGSVFETTRDIVRDDGVADLLTLKQCFANSAALKAAGGDDYLARLAASAVPTVNALHYAKLIREHAIVRAADADDLMLGGDLAKSVYESGSAATVLAKYSEKIARLQAMVPAGRGGDGIADALSEATAAIEDAWRNGDAPKGVTTGLRDLDDHVGGLQASNVIVLAGRPGMGKTALALLMALEAAKSDTRVGFISLEMSRTELVKRLQSLETGIEAERLTRGKLDQEHFDRIHAANKKLDTLPLHIDDRGGLTLDQISGTAHRWKRDGLGLLIVDHLGLILPPDSHARANKVHQVEHNTNGLKALAKSLDIPIVLLTQLNRAVETRDNKRPTLADLRDSGSIEQDADAVLLLYRDAYYLARDELAKQRDYAKWLEDMEDVRHEAEIEIAKFRHGPVGRIECIFDDALMRFRDRAKQYESEA